MAETKTKGTARVQVTLEITPGGGDWGGGCTLDQLRSQAAESALQELGFVLKACRMGFRTVESADGQEMEPVVRRYNMRMVGRPKVTAVLVEEK